MTLVSRFRELCFFADEGRDLATFDVKEYTAQSSSSNLPSLLKNTNELISDLKIFESSKKSLIYNNYTSLIGASDTVSRMRVELNGLEKELDALDHIAQAISNDLSAINQRASVKDQSADTIKSPI